MNTRPKRSRICGPFLAFGLTAVVVTGLFNSLCAPAAGQVSESQASQLVVYLDNLDLVQSVAEVTLEEMSLAGASGDRPLRLAMGKFTSNQPRTDQVRLADEEIPAGSYLGLRFRLGVNYTVDDTVEVTDSVVASVPLGLQLGPGEIAAVFLEFGVSGAADSSGRAGVEIAIAEPRIPPFNALLFVTNEGSRNISVLDKHSNRVVDVLAGGKRPLGMAYSRFARELYVADAGDHTVAVIDVTTRQMIRQLRLNLDDEPTRLALSPDGQRLYVLNEGSHSVAMFDAGSDQELGRFSVDLHAVSLDVDPSSGWVYIANELSDNISLYDPSEETVVTTIPAGSLPTEIALVIPEGLVCVASSAQRIITVLSSSTGNLQATFGLCAIATGLAYDRVQGMMYVAAGECHEITAFRPANVLSTGQVPLPGAPGLLTIDEENRRLYAILPEQNRLAVINLTGRRIAAVVEVGDKPYMAMAAQ